MRVVGVDFSVNMINAAREKLKGSENAAFRVGRADELPFEPPDV